MTDTIRRNADRLHAHLTDYTEGIEPSMLYKTIYLTEFERVHGITNPQFRRELGELRATIKQACGIR